MKKYAQNLTEKIISEHLVRGRMEVGTEIFLRVDSTLVHDMSGTLAYIGFEAMGIDKIQVPAAVTFQDHNLVAMDHRSLDDHRFVASAARRYGSMLSKAGNGICHSVYYSRIGRPGTVLAGADSHSATAGALGMLGVGLGGLDVSAIMGGEPMELKMPAVIGVEVKGKLKPGVSAKDAALWLLKQLSVKGGVGKVLEYFGEGVENLSVPQRATIANMGAEMGATSSVFPADEAVRRFLKAQGREEHFRELAADPGAVYGMRLTLDLSRIVPSVAVPPMPDQVKSVREAGPVKVDQVYIGSCTNGSYYDLARAARVLRGRRVHPDVNLLVSPSNRQVYQMLLEDGSIGQLVRAGARIMECGCGPCIGLGQAPPTGGVSVRTSNRNFKGRCGTTDASVYLAGPAVAAAAAVTGYLCPPDEVISLEELAGIGEPEVYFVDDVMIALPAVPETRDHVEVVRGPSIRPIPLGTPQNGEIRARVVKKLGDNVSTDEIAPTGPEYGALRSNVPEAAKTAFIRSDPGFYGRALEYGSSVILAGENYGQGSSREHAALLPAYLGVRAVIARSFARIHRTNLINFGVLPLVFAEGSGPELAEEGQELVIQKKICAGETSDSWYTITAGATGKTFEAVASLTEREREIYAAGGLLSFIKGKY